jgi:hypothetical protein
MCRASLTTPGQPSKLGELWMPFIENPADALGKTIQQSPSRKAVALHQIFSALRHRRVVRRRLMRVDAATIIENSLTNQKPMDRLHGSSPTADD